MQKYSEFDVQKNKGNELFQEAKSSTEQDRNDLLQQARHCYESAAKHARSPGDDASINKNIGSTYLEQARAAKNTPEYTNITHQRPNYGKDATMYLKKAQKHGQAANKTSKWQNQLTGLISEAIELAKSSESKHAREVEANTKKSIKTGNVTSNKQGSAHTEPPKVTQYICIISHLIRSMFLSGLFHKKSVKLYQMLEGERCSKYYVNPSTFSNIGL